MIVRAMAVEDLLAVVALQRLAFPPPFPEDLLWRAEHLARHLEIFPEGQFVAWDGEVVGSASATLLGEETWAVHADWDATVGGPFLETFDRHGSTLYGLDISVHPDWRGQGVGRALYGARFDLVRGLGLVRYGTTCRLPGLAGSGLSPEAYLEEVARGRRSDRTLTPLLRIGLRATGVAENHMDDPESQDCAAILEWVPG